MKHCLIIDDQDQKDQIALLESESVRLGFPITGHFFNITEPDLLYRETMDGKPVDLIDVDKVIEKLKIKYINNQFDLIACDYQYDDKMIDGLKLIKFLKENNFKGKKIPYLIYSNDHEEVKDKLQGDVRQHIDDKNTLMTFLESYFDSKPDAVIERTSYYNSIIEFLKKNKTPLSLKLDSKLREYPEKKFNNIFPRFKDKTLLELANMIQKSSAESDDFESEFLERSVAHFIYLEE